MNTPVVFLVFSRPETTARVLERIRGARPPKLLVVCDAARPDRPGEAERVAEVRKLIAEGVDWPCEVQTNYAERNLGCRERVFSGLDWAFSLVEEAIILEDDCLPDPTFFTFCETLLARYRNDTRIFHIGANNFQGWRRRSFSSYFFSKYNHIWGWATWRRAWQLIDRDAECWMDVRRRLVIKRTFDTPEERAYWSAIFDLIQNPETRPNTWDYSWMLTCWNHRALAVYPERNLVENIGFGEGATHTAEKKSERQLPAQPIEKIHFPRSIKRCVAADMFTFKTVFMREATFPLSWWYQLRIFAGWLKQEIT